jgi:hypothetical protein
MVGMIGLEHLEIWIFNQVKLYGIFYLNTILMGNCEKNWLQQRLKRQYGLNAHTAFSQTIEKPLWSKRDTSRTLFVVI